MNTEQAPASSIAQINPGEVLRRARESRELSLADAALQLNLTQTMLGYIETGAFDKMSGHTFARGYVRAYAKLLKLDPAQLVEQFDRYTGTDAKGSAVHELGRLREPVKLSHRLLSALSVVLLLAGAGVAYMLWNERSLPTAINNLGLAEVEVEAADGSTQVHSLEEPEDQAAQQAVSELPLAPVNPEGSDAAASTPETTTPAATSEPQAQTPQTSPAQALPLSTQPAARPAVNAASAPAASAAEVAPVNTPAATPTVALVAGEGRVSIQFIANCWAQLTDAKGKVLFSALKHKGETLDVAGLAPLELRLGYAPGAQVSFNGQSVDLVPFTSGETARVPLGR